VVYDRGPLAMRPWDADFDGVRERVALEWRALPPSADNISASLKAKISACMKSPLPGSEDSHRALQSQHEITLSS
jgi:hypothetical protein